jgi:hypothetical protein
MCAFFLLHFRCLLGQCVLLFTYLLIFLFQTEGYSVSEQDKIQFSMRIVRFLLPWLKEFHQEQMQEKSAEAATKGSMIATAAFGFLVYVHGCYSLVINIFCCS